MKEHPTVRRYYENSADIAYHEDVPRLNTGMLRQMCLELGADDVGFVEINREELAEQKDDISGIFPEARTLISFVCRINRENLRNPARSIANLELRIVGQRVNSVAHTITASLEKMGVRALSPAEGFPMETDKWPGKMQVVSHKPVAAAAGLGKMGLHRNIIHPVFGSFVLLGTVLINAEVDAYSRPLEYDPCLKCKLCATACPVGAIGADGYYNPINCLTHTYRELLGGFSDWVETIADSKNAFHYRKRVSDAETVSMWQSLAIAPCYKSVYCMAVCPAGDEVIPDFLTDRKKYIDTVVRPLQKKEETICVLPGSDAENHVLRIFPHKKVKRVGNGVRLPTIEAFLRSVPIAFQRHKAEGLEATFHFAFSGNEMVNATIVIRDKTLSVIQGQEGRADLLIKADSAAWLRAVNKESSMFREIVFRRIRLKGPLRLLKAFGNCFS